ncbi:MAG: rhodanese-like domain-containing protein [Myxococcales bacterium]|nr:rhodanese-like domain-containing protein [Myxococcales bacterium]
MPNSIRGLTSASLAFALALVGGAALSVGCAGSSSQPPAAAQGDAAKGEALADRDPELACRLVRQEGAVLLDVRSADEFAEGHVDGAVNIPHDQIDARAAEIDELQGGDKSKPIVAYCVSGRRAGIAKQSLMDQGRTKVTNLGGMKDWPECPG